MEFIKDIYEECPIYQNDLILLKQTTEDDIEELLKCYSDVNSVPLFNSDNCHGDDFHYITVERMKKAFDFWEYSYKNKYFVRWTVIDDDSHEKIGTVEMFHRNADDKFNHHGVLRLDLRSEYEKQKYIEPIIKIVNQNFYEAFNVKNILTKAIPMATERIEVLKRNGYETLNEKLMTYGDYFIR